VYGEQERILEDVIVTSFKYYHSVHLRN